MERGKSLSIFSFIESSLKQDSFLDKTGLDESRVDSFIEECRVRDMADEIKYATISGGRFHAEKVLNVIKKYVPRLKDEPVGGWAKYCFDYVLSEIYPETKTRDRSLDARYEVGRLIFLHILRGLYRYEEETLLFDPTRNIHLPNDGEGEGITARELLRLKEVIREEYIYEFLRIASDITPFDTLGHMGGVHYIAMYAARQLKNAGVPVDLALISGAACGHDIGKFGCRKEEERRIPYLHYYYTDICYDRFNLHTMGHIAANHSTWDLELEDLSVESLLLIYADFRVKSDRDVEGNEVVKIYSLKDSFNVILNKLDNVDDAKEARYRKVYAKLKDFEDFMKDKGVSVNVPDNLGDIVPEINPSKKERALLEGEDIVKELKYSAIEHNIKLMSILHVDSELADLIEAARSESAWKNLRTYIGLFAEYFTYMSEKQKTMTLRFLYELLAHKENDIRTQAAELMGEIVAGFNVRYMKELPEGTKLPLRAVSNKDLFSEYLEKILYPERRFTEQHRAWMRACLGSFISALLNHCEDNERQPYTEILRKYYEQSPSGDKELSIVLLNVLEEIDEDWCGDAFMDTCRDYIAEALGVPEKEVRIAALRAEKHLLMDMSNDEYFSRLISILELPGDVEALLERESNIFLDDLKMGTHWIVKVANIQIMKNFGRMSNSSGVILHIGAHLVNLLKVNERVEVRKAAGDALLELLDLMPNSQRNEMNVELYNGLEMGERQYAKNVPYYFGKTALALSKAEFEETIDTIEEALLNKNTKVSAFMIEAVGVILENYRDFEKHSSDSYDEHVERKVRLLHLMIKAYAHYDPQFSRDAFRDIGKYVFGSDTLSDEDKELLFTRSYKKILQLLDENPEDTLSFYSNAAVLNHIYRYISACEQSGMKFDFPIKERVCFYPGTFDPFSLGHKAVAQKIRDMDMDVYLSLDEFSWSKHTQPKLLRRRIMTMSVAGEEGIYSFPDDIPINIANENDIKTLKELFKDKELYIAVGTDVIENASAYRNEPTENSIHSLNHITFERETRENSRDGSERNYPVTGKCIHLTLDKFYEDISSTRIRENIDLNRDISNLIDTVAQNFIYDKNMYLREPTYKHVIESREISIEGIQHRGCEGLGDFMPGLIRAGYDATILQDYLSGPKVYEMYINDVSPGGSPLGYAAFHKVGTRDLLSEFESQEFAEKIRSNTDGAIGVISLVYFDDSSRISGASQMLITELMTELISKDYSYAVYHPVDPAGYSDEVINALKLQGFVDISGGHSRVPLYAVSLKAPVVIFKDVETVIKAPFNKNKVVLHAIEESHNHLLGVLSSIYPNKLLLSFDTSAIQHKIINKACALNGVSQIEGESPRGPLMAVPFGKALGDVLIPNTVTKTLLVEKYFNRTVKGFTIAESRNNSPLDTQARMIKSFNRPIILIDDLLHKSHRMNILGPVLQAADVDVREVLVGVMTGNAMDRMEANQTRVECAYFLPTLEVWMNERDCYPFIGGDSIESIDSQRESRGASANLILPYIKPGFIGNGDEEAAFVYSETCLKNARRIMGAIESEYQKLFERKLTLRRLGEVVTIPRIPDMDRGVIFDESMEPTEFLDNDIERVARLKWGEIG